MDNIEKDEILLQDYFDNLLSQEEQLNFEEYIVNNIELAIELGRLKNLKRSLANLPSTFSPSDSVIENIVNSLLDSDSTNENIDLDIDANLVELETEIESESQIELKQFRKEKNEKRKLKAKTKFRLKRLFFVVLFLTFLGAIGYGYDKYTKDSKTTPWQVDILNASSTVRSSSIGLNNTVKTESNEQAQIDIEAIAQIKLSNSSGMKLLSGTKSFNEIIFYSGKLIFTPKENNNLFRLKFGHVSIDSENSSFTVEKTNRTEVTVLTNYIVVRLNNFEYKIPNNYKFNIWGENEISIPIRTTTSKKLKNFVSLYAVSPSDILLKKIITSTNKGDAYTLHYMLSIVTPKYREQIIDRLQKFIPLPTTTDKIKVLMLDDEALNIWWEEVYFAAK